MVNGDPFNVLLISLRTPPLSSIGWQRVWWGGDLLQSRTNRWPQYVKSARLPSVTATGSWPPDTLPRRKRYCTTLSLPTHTCTRITTSPINFSYNLSTSLTSSHYHRGRPTFRQLCCSALLLSHSALRSLSLSLPPPLSSYHTQILLHTNISFPIFRSSGILILFYRHLEHQQ